MSVRAQADDLVANENDEAAKTSEERQHLIEQLLASARQFQSSNDFARAASLLNRAARLQFKLNQLDEALSTYRAASALLKRTPDLTVNIDNLNGLARVYAHLNQCEKAEPRISEALRLSEQINSLAGRAEALLTLSDCQNHSEHVKALRTAQESLALWQSLNRKHEVALTQQAIGDYQLEQNNLSEASESYQAALDIWRELNSRDGEAEALISLGFVEYRKGAWQNSMSFLAQAQALLDDKADAYKMGQITASIGEAFIESGLPETAIPKLEQAVQYFGQARSPLAVIVANWDLGRAYYFLEDYPKALAILEQALRGAESIRDLSMTAMSHDYLGRTFAATNDSVNALHNFQLALAGYSKVGDRMEEARTRALLGQFFEEQGQPENARAYYEQALQTFNELADQVNQSATLYALGRLELKRNQLSEAERDLRRSIEVTEDMRRVSSSRDLTAAISATVHDRYQSYVECLMREHRDEPARGFEILALQTSELARGRALAELLSATGTNVSAGIDPRLATQEQQLRQTLRAKEDYRVTLLGKTYQKSELDTLQAEIIQLDSQYKKVSESIRSRYPAYDQLTRPTALNLRQIQQQVINDDQTLLLEYSLGVQESYVWAVTNNAMSSYQLPSETQIAAATNKVYELLKEQPSPTIANDLAEASQQLSRMVLVPVSSHLDKRRIIIVADGVLNYVPFQILSADEVSNEPLIASHEVVNVPSASILGQLQQEVSHRGAAAEVLALFGDPVFASNYTRFKPANNSTELVPADRESDSRWPSAVRDIESDAIEPTTIQPLFYAHKEVGNLRNIAGANSLIATGFEASLAKLQTTPLEHYAILHFATHGILDPRKPANSGLILSMVGPDGRTQNGFVGLEDIYRLHAPVDLVVLSACRTGLGKNVRGEGLIGLTRGFMYAGAASVVASLWKVDDEATAELMKRFYSKMLQEGLAPSAALREAQNSIRRESQWTAPYYWAAFTLQGNYRNPIRTRSAGTPSLAVFVCGGIGLLLLSVLILYSHRRMLAQLPRPIPR